MCQVLLVIVWVLLTVDEGSEVLSLKCDVCMRHCCCRFAVDVRDGCRSRVAPGLYFVVVVLCVRWSFTLRVLMWEL